MKHSLIQPDLAVADAGATSDSRVARLNARWRSLQAERVLRMAIFEEFPGRVAVSSSFGAESAVLLHTYPVPGYRKALSGDLGVSRPVD